MSQTLNQLYSQLFDELHSLGAAVSNIATELEHTSPEHAQRLHTLAATAVRMSVIRPTLLESHLTSSAGSPSPNWILTSAT